MTLKGTIVLSDFVLDLPLSKRRQIIRAVGNKLATRIRKRLKASGRFQKSGQLVRSVKFRLRRGQAVGVIAPMGVRIDSDTHERRQPLSNFSIAAFHAAQGKTVIAMTEDDELFAAKEVGIQLAKMLAKVIK